ncbi:MAG: hypothetical protein FWB71_04895 [Defluviitaleaceae bacterium]|nr:hypothetical protein [Defluviitaleaceae bacterium]
MNKKRAISAILAILLVAPIVLYAATNFGGNSPANTMRFGYVSAGAHHVLLVHYDGSLWAWGDYRHGRLGFDASEYQTSPARVGDSYGWASVSAGASHSLAIKQNGSLWTWGINLSDTLAVWPPQIHYEPVRIGDSYEWASISAGSVYTLGIKTDGSLWGWGVGTHGQLGIYPPINRHPTRIGELYNWKSISAGEQHSLAIQADGSLWAWGANTSGQLGNGTNVASFVPIHIGVGYEWKIAQAGSSFRFSVAIRADGSLWAWGQDIGAATGVIPSQSLVPVRIGDSYQWSFVSAGGTHASAIKSDGSLWAWGVNPDGRLGAASENTLVPVRVRADYNWARVSAGFAMTMGIRTNGDLYGWGGNRRGEVGDGTGGVWTGANDRRSPVFLKQGSREILVYFVTEKGFIIDEIGRTTYLYFNMLNAPDLDADGVATYFDVEGLPCGVEYNIERVPFNVDDGMDDGTVLFRMILTVLGEIHLGRENCECD